MNLASSRWVVTGASGGIGQALVEELCRRGARVLVAGRQADTLHALAESHPQRVRVVVADLRTPAGRQAVVDAARDIGHVDGLINAAGVNHFGLFDGMDDAAIEQMVALNLTATLQLTHAMLPLLRERPRATVAFLGSIFGSIGYPGQAVYSATKFALRGFAEALRRELADGPVRVLYAAPRSTRTAMNADAMVQMNRQLQVAMDPPETVARRIADALRDERKEIYLGRPEKFFVRLNGLLPRLVDRALRKQLPVIQRFARQPTQGTASP